MRRLVVLVALGQSGCGLFLEGPRPPDAAVSDVDAPRHIDADLDAGEMDDAFGDDASADDAFGEDAPTDDASVSEPDAGPCPADMCGEIATRMGVVDIDVSEDGTRAVMLGTAGAWLYPFIPGASASGSTDVALPRVGCTRIAVSDNQSSVVVLCDGAAHHVSISRGTSENLGTGYVAVASGGFGSADTFALLHGDGYVELRAGGMLDIRYTQSISPYCTSGPVWLPPGEHPNLAMHPIATAGVFVCDPEAVDTIAVGGPGMIHQTFYADSASPSQPDCTMGSCCSPNPTELFVDVSVLPHVVATISGNAIRFPRNGAFPPLVGSEGEPLTSVSLGLVAPFVGTEPESFLVAWSTDYGAFARIWSESACSPLPALRIHTAMRPVTKVRVSRCEARGTESEPHFTAITLEEGGLATLRRVTCPLP